MQKGKFIVIEGGDGAGKDTQIDLLKKALGEERFLYTRDPGGTELGMKLREILQYGEGIAQETELLLFLASRAQLVQEVILPTINRGTHVICNRFDASTVAYQIYARERRGLENLVRAASVFARGDANPDLIVYLDVSPEIGLARGEKRGERKTRFEGEEITFHERVREGYRAALRDAHKAVVIDADRDIETIHKEVLEAVRDITGA